MSPLRSTLVEISQVAMAVGIGGFWVWILLTRQRRIVNQREHKAGIQTLFNGKK
ncbi:MAG TPA: hypothetical protein VHZ25_01185 [Acidobacteriaceae bacterium]|jgi:hypothetical protein|nr:hypothetical protein [Acidobacteriaceae bacterium]